jgi:hypothetical protein
METRDDRRANRNGDQAQSWPALAAQLILDFTKVLEAEARLMRASLEPSLTAVLEHWLLHLVIASIAMVGCILLIGAVVLLLHGWLAWWLSLAITGTLAIMLALCALLIR